MSEGAEKSVEELLAEAAAATHAANPPKAKKERKPKEAVDGEAKPARTPREPKPAKQYPQANEDGTAKLNEDGTPVLGPKETAYKAPKKTRTPKLYPQFNEDGTPQLNADNTPVMGTTKPPKAAKAPRPTKVTFSVGGEVVTLESIQNEAHIEVVGNIGSKEGSKRAERMKAFNGASNVAEFFSNGGLKKDLIRHLKSGAVKLEIPGRGGVAVDAGAQEAGTPVGQAVDTATQEGQAKSEEAAQGGDDLRDPDAQPNTDAE